MCAEGLNICIVMAKLRIIKSTAKEHKLHTYVYNTNRFDLPDTYVRMSLKRAAHKGEHRHIRQIPTESLLEVYPCF